MRAIVQRVTSATVETDKKITGSINLGILILLGIEAADNTNDITWLASKIARMRIFNDDKGVMNLSLLDVAGEALVVSQFTLHASIKKGNRPYYGRSAEAEFAIPLYEKFLETLEKEIGKPVATGKFGACMSVKLENDGPVTIILDSKNIE